MTEGELIEIEGRWAALEEAVEDAELHLAAFAEHQAHRPSKQETICDVNHALGGAMERCHEDLRTLIELARKAAK